MGIVERLDTFAAHGIRVKSDAVGEVDVVCPECSPERTKKNDPCLSVNVDEGTWYCHHCGWSGGLKRDTAGRIERRRKTYKRPEPLPPSDLTPKALAWFQQRGITPEVLQRNQIQSGAAWMPQTGAETSVVQFPYYRGETLVNVKHRDGQKHFRMEKGAERVLYGLNDLGNTRAVIVEGEIDKLSVEVAGITACVSVPDGAPTPDTKNYSSKFEFLDADADRLAKVPEWIIAVDGDEPGERLRAELVRRFGVEKCRYVEWPEGCKDANDVLVKLGAGALANCIAEAKQFPLDGVFTASDMHAQIESLYKHGWERGAHTGWNELDTYFSVRPGEFTVVTGIPNSGKSNFIDALCVNLAKQHGWRIAMFSPENQPLEDHAARLMEKWARKPFFDGPTQRMDADTRDLAEQWVSDHFDWILPDDDDQWTVDLVLERARQLVYRRGTNALVIDPWNELEDGANPGESETQYISRALKRIRQFGRRHHIHIFVVVHPAKMLRDKDGRYPIPTLYDCAGSAHWRNKADNGLCVWRDFSSENRMMDVYVQKVRFRQVGKLGCASLKYEPATGTYTDSIDARYA